jgi:D-psicose/D-tagatose/L-ribulose 3-epimerase
MTQAMTSRRRHQLIALRTLLGLAGLGLGAFSATGTAAAAKGPAMTIGLASDDMEKAKRVGFDYVELGVKNFVKLSDDEFKAFQEKHKALGIPTPVGNNFIPVEIKVVGPEIDKAKQDEYVKKAFDRSKQLGLKIIVFGSGGARKVPDGFAKEEAYKQLVEFAKRIAPEAKKRGIVVAVEPLQSKETNIINTAAEGLKWVNDVKHPSFQLMVDFYHLSLEKEDPEILVTGKKAIKHIHIANPNKRAFPMSAEEFDYSVFFEKLKAIKYRGGISVEGRTSDYDNEAPKALAFLRGAVASGVKPPANPPPPATPAAPAAPAAPKATGPGSAPTPTTTAPAAK